MMVVPVVVVVLLLIWIANSVQTIQEGERGLILRLGRFYPPIREPGKAAVYWPIDTLVRVSVKETEFRTPVMAFLTSDNLQVGLTGHGKYRIVQPEKALFAVRDVASAISQIVQGRLGGEGKNYSHREIHQEFDALVQAVTSGLRKDLTEMGCELTELELEFTDVQD